MVLRKLNRLISNYCKDEEQTKICRRQVYANTQTTVDKISELSEYSCILTDKWGINDYEYFLNKKSWGKYDTRKT